MLLLTVASHFEVASFDGTKSVVLSTMGYLGGKHLFMAVAYLVVGVLALLLGIIFFGLNLTRGRCVGGWRVGSGGGGGWVEWGGWRLNLGMLDFF